ncbi:HAD-like domain-containing protein [Dipodascopsis tothii]|uniref:HAD-like domain-containing protein n=1 Tax=Dipodascopsis tothii TaxID=44089 RepID=UPI0034CDCBDE
MGAPRTAHTGPTLTPRSPTFPRRPVHVLVDWDETVTARDTLEVLADAAYGAHARAGRAVEPWKHFVDTYLADYSTKAASLPPRKTAEDEAEFAVAMRPVEDASVARVSAGGVFAGLTPVDLDSAAAAVDALVRPGWWEFYADVQTKASVAICSVNWCASVIRRVLASRGSSEIAANDFELDADGTTTGTITGTMRASPDKVAVVDRAREDSRVVYIGDSGTDLGALLTADTGIIFDSGKGFPARVRALGIAVEPIEAYRAHAVSRGRTVFVAPSWAAITDARVVDMEQ